MKTLALIAVLALIATPFPFVQASEDGGGPDMSPEWLVMQHTIQEILAGGQLSPRSAMIAPGARLAVGDSLLDLAAAIEESHEALRIPEESQPPVGIRQRMSPNGEAAFLLLGAQHDSGMRYHTVVFMKDSTGTWMLESWHASP